MPDLAAAPRKTERVRCPRSLRSGPGKAGRCALHLASRRNKPQDQSNPYKNFAAVHLAGGLPDCG